MAVHGGGLEVIAYTDQTLLLLLAFNKERRESSRVACGIQWRREAEEGWTQRSRRRSWLWVERPAQKPETSIHFFGHKWKQEQIFMVCSSGAKRLQLRFSSQLLTASKKQQPMKKKEEVEEIVVGGLVWILSALQVSERSSGGLFSQKVNFLLRSIVMHVQGLICLRRASRKDGN